MGLKLLAMGLLLPKGVAQDRQAGGAFAEQTQPDGEGIAIQGRNPRLVGPDASPVDVGIRWLHRCVLSQQ